MIENQLFAKAKKNSDRLARALIVWAICLVSCLFFAPAWAAGSGTSGDPFTTLADAYTAPTGRHFFNLGSGAFQADVDNSEGGGWVLVLQYVHNGGTNPALSITGAGADLPVTSAAALGTDESGTSAKWGHVGIAAMCQFPGDNRHCDQRLKRAGNHIRSFRT